MSYKDIETSINKRQPIRLYQFERGVFRWLYNSSAQAISYKNQLFKSLKGGVSDRGIIRSDGGQSDNFIITAPADIELAKLFLNMPPSARIQLTVFNTHLSSSDAVPRWYGAINTINYSEVDRIEIICTPNATLSNRPGATEVYSRQCCAVIYNKRCGVNKELFKTEGTIQQITPAAIEVPEAAGFSNGWFSGGFIEFDIGSGELDRRYIEQHAGTTLVLWGGGIGLKVGQSIKFYPGCDTAPTTCKNKFDNAINRKSFDHLQGTSPFDGNQVWR